MFYVHEVEFDKASPVVFTETDEVSLAQDALVRDTKNASGDVLAFSAPAWRALISSL